MELETIPGRKIALVNDQGVERGQSLGDPFTDGLCSSLASRGADPTLSRVVVMRLSDYRKVQNMVHHVGDSVVELATVDELRKVAFEYDTQILEELKSRRSDKAFPVIPGSDADGKPSHQYRFDEWGSMALDYRSKTKHTPKDFEYVVICGNRRRMCYWAAAAVRHNVYGEDIAYHCAIISPEEVATATLRTKVRSDENARRGQSDYKYLDQLAIAYTFVKERGCTISDIERELNLPHGTATLIGNIAITAARCPSCHIVNRMLKPVPTTVDEKGKSKRLDRIPYEPNGFIPFGGQLFSRNFWQTLNGSASTKASMDEDIATKVFGYETEAARDPNRVATDEEVEEAIKVKLTDGKVKTRALSSNVLETLGKSRGKLSQDLMTAITSGDQTKAAKMLEKIEGLTVEKSETIAELQKQIDDLTSKLKAVTKERDDLKKELGSRKRKTAKKSRK